MYSDIITEQYKRVFIEKVPHPQTTVGTCHHAEFKESATSPICVVYDDCSCGQSQEYPSLNNSLLPRPPITDDFKASREFQNAWLFSYNTFKADVVKLSSGCSC